MTMTIMNVDDVNYRHHHHHRHDYDHRYLGDVTTHLKPRPWSCYNPFPALNDGEQYTAFVFLRPSSAAPLPSPQAPPQSRDNTCGGNCPNGCSDCPCGSTPAVVDPGHWCNLGTSSGWEEDSCTCILQAREQQRHRQWKFVTLLHCRLAAPSTARARPRTPTVNPYNSIC